MKKISKIESDYNLAQLIQKAKDMVWRAKWGRKKLTIILLIFMMSCQKTPLPSEQPNTNEQILVADETYFRSSMDDSGDFEIISYNDSIVKMLSLIAYNPYGEAIIDSLHSDDGATQLFFQCEQYSEVENKILTYNNGILRQDSLLGDNIIPHLGSYKEGN